MSRSAGCATRAHMTELDAVVAGDAAITFAWQVSVPPAPGRTSKLLGAVEPEGRFGGCAPGGALALAELGHRVALVSWLGDDDYGRAYLTHLQSGGVDIAGVEIAAGQSSARALMLYDGNGSATCLHHPSGSGSLSLPAAGRDRLDHARWLVLTAGPAGMTQELLDARGRQTSVAWNVKGDPSHYPIALRRRVIQDAQLGCFNLDELAFLAEAPDLPAGAGPGRALVPRPQGGRRRPPLHPGRGSRSRRHVRRAPRRGQGIERQGRPAHHGWHLRWRPGHGGGVWDGRADRRRAARGARRDR